ncbi:MAG: OmpW family protein [Alphaproteobacteria bacterium]|nr:outer membrane beta-barrel protein [Alphaproteobacteria bacterium]MDE2110939.1 OmpW family protein [Alphaproteobacteria bacterium]MDE2495422.1 OmpW family protein [Alphaproteobacteria bacterium]
MRIKHVLFATAAVALVSGSAFADGQEGQSPWQIRLRAVGVVPQPSATVTPIGGTVNITDSIVPEADVTYFFDNNWSVEVIAATTKHSVRHSSDAYLGAAWLLPPTATLQYHFDQLKVVRPYVGAGLNYTFFYNPDPGALGQLHLTDRLGYALQVGADVPFGDQGYFFNVDVKKIFLSTHASFRVSPVTAKVSIDPWLIGVGVGIRF